MVEKVRYHWMFTSKMSTTTLLCSHKLFILLRLKKTYHLVTLSWQVWTQSIKVYLGSVIEDQLITSMRKSGIKLILIVAVEAYDKDSGENGRIKYSLDDQHFTINDRGEICGGGRLDADQNRERFFIYRFNVTATDHGEPSLSSTAMVTWHFPFIQLSAHLCTNAS